MYPHFWAKVLAPVTKVNDVEVVKFASPKDKVRDMLAFYWSYKHVDKLEMMRGTLGAVDRKVQFLDKKVRELSTNIKSPKLKSQSKKRAASLSVIKDHSKEWNAIKTQIDAAEVVSFDVFDTLLVRPFAVPNDLFTYIETLVGEVTDGKIVDGQFRELREKARGLVKNSQCGEEVSLQERYEAIGKVANLTDEQTQNLHELELSLELNTLYARSFMTKIYEYAKSQGKFIVILSDTFFTSEFLNNVLSKNGITGYNLIWSSMETKLLKHTGNVYPKLIEEVGVSADKILHVGDNKIADIEKAGKHGIETLYVPRTLDAFKEKTGLDKSTNFSDHLSRSLTKGLIANKVMDAPMNYSYPSHSGGSLFNLGYSMVGPMFYGFANWVYQQALEKGLDKVYFLARDGEIIKKCYDVITENISGAPKSEYVHVSRRALSVPSIKTDSEIDEMARINFSPTPITKLLNSRFGLSSPVISKAVLKEVGFSNPNELINSKRDADKFVEFCLLIKEQIFKQAELEREGMLDYLSSKGLDGKDSTLVVDIGHNGTLQKRLNRLLETDKIDGLYFVTQSGVKETIYDNGWSASGYVAEAINGSDRRYPYNKYLLMFEACFLNAEGSTISISKSDSGEFKVNQLSVENEAERINFINNTHEGVLSFVTDINSISKQLSVDINITGRESINPFLSMLNHPYELDLLMFNKVAFENVYSGRDQKYLILYNPESRKDSIEHSYWVDAMDVMSWDACNDDVKSGLVNKLIFFIIGMANRFNMVSDAKFKKFKREPRVFFEDSDSKVFNRLSVFF